MHPLIASLRHSLCRSLPFNGRAIASSILSPAGSGSFLRSRHGSDVGDERRGGTRTGFAVQFCSSADVVVVGDARQEGNAAHVPVSLNEAVDYFEDRSHRGSVDNAETAKFAAIADTWWDHHGPYKPLHAMNPVRLSFIRSALCQHFRKDMTNAKPLDGLKLVDVGCGGGLVCEPLARMGAQVLGVDAVEENINVASVHALKDPSTSSVQYRCTTAEQLVHEKQEFDAVLSLEVIEHVADPMEFCKSLAALAKKDGMVIISTLNRSIPSYGVAIVGAEYILGWLPKGTHDWSRFITPEELALITKRASLSMEEMAGMVFNPCTGKWSLSDDTSVNYIASSVKRGTSYWYRYEDKKETSL